jgi:hypothetical protein
VAPELVTPPPFGPVDPVLVVALSLELSVAPPEETEAPPPLDPISSEPEKSLNPRTSAHPDAQSTAQTNVQSELVETRFIQEPR